ncbi:MAG: hypothetical protein HY842_18710 [Bacteroidetes bacterium]|nr:hypothetical protein [Bacteroidota bacterium]
MTWKFLLPIIADCLAILIALYFLITDALRQSSSSNGMLSLVTFGMCCWVGLCFYLHHIGKITLATSLAWIPAIPLLGYGLLVLLMVILKPDFK